MSRPVRRSQAISPFGIGALVDFPGPVSLIHAGIDAWPFDENNPEHREYIVDDEKRLSKRLGVDYFVQPPDFRRAEKGQTAAQPNLNLKLPFLRFPLWHACPRCGRMHMARFHDNTAPSCIGPIGSGSERGSSHPQRKAVQVRFVTACTRGHLQDFPWLEWLFKTSQPEWFPDGHSKWLRLRSTGSASVTGVEVSAEEREANGGIRIVEKRTLAGAFAGDPNSGSPSAFTAISVKCEGQNPVLAIGGQSALPLPGCGQELYTLLRGASNLYFSQVVSSIYIPDVDDRGLSQEILDLLDDHQLKSSLLLNAQSSESGLVTAKGARNALRQHCPEFTVDPEVLADAANKHILANALFENRKIHAFLSQKIKASTDQKLSLGMVASAVKSFCPDWDIDPSILQLHLSPKFGLIPGPPQEQATRQDPLAESAYRFQEYRVFCQDIQEGYPKTNLLIKSSSIAEYGSIVSATFERVSLLHKLRETRAFVGFSRIFPDNDLTQDERWNLFAREKRMWLPASIVRGEGIFLKFREDRLANWMSKHGDAHAGRLSTLNRKHDELRSRRHQLPILVTPKHVLIHTFAHLLINQLIYECGYGSASLRERIYSADGDNAMSGVLIYTAAGDSEGTMGGLVKMGQADSLELIMAKALERARWCSSDPVCIESTGQGPDNCNLGACHSCALLPETSCEEQNRLLDRGVVVGTLDMPDIGYFPAIPM